MMEPNHEDSSSESDNEVEKKRRGTNSADRGCRQKSKSKQRKETQKRSTATGVFENARATQGTARRETQESSRTEKASTGSSQKKEVKQSLLKRFGRR